MPLVFRKRLGSIETVLTVLLLAVSPSAVVTSREMTGVGLAMLAVVAMLAAVDRYFTTARGTYGAAAGGALAIALLADFGSLAVIASIAAGFGFAVLTDEEGHFSREAIAEAIRPFPWGIAVGTFATTLFMLSTLFYLTPNGLGAAADELARFFGGLVTRPADVPYLGLVLAVNEPFLLIVGLTGAWIASQSPIPWKRFLAGWGIAAVIISLLYPGALPAHSLWCVIPLSALASLLLVQLLRPVENTPGWGIAAHAGGTAALMAMILDSLALQLQSPQVWPIGPEGLGIQTYVVMIAFGIILTILLWLIAASVWSPTAAWHGFGGGVALAGLLMALGSSASIAFTRPGNPFDLFNQSPADPLLPMMISTAEDVSTIATGDPHDASLTVVGDPNGALAWALRKFKDVHYVRDIAPGTRSAMVVTPLGNNQPNLASNYVGQGFVVTRQWSPSTLNATQFLAWALYRTADPSTLGKDQVILWVREDVYNLAPDRSMAP